MRTFLGARGEDENGVRRREIVGECQCVPRREAGRDVALMMT